MSKNKILRLFGFNHRIGDVEYKLPETPDSEYVVDDSSFVPIAEAIKQLGNGLGTGNRLQQLYDFPDGKDTGAQIPFSRSSQFKDIAELSSHISEAQEEVSNELEKAKRLQDFKDKLNSSDIESPSAPSTD